MIQGIVLCGLGVLTLGLGIKQFWDMKKAEPSVEETPAPEKVEPTDADVAE